MMITGIEATRPQCGKKAWQKSENVRSAERAYTRFPGLKPRARSAGKSVAEIGNRKKRGARLYEIPGIEATRPQCAVIMRKDPI